MPGREPPGFTYNSRAWQKVVAEAKRRDGYRCVKCGARGREIGGTAVLTGAHKTPARVAPHLALMVWNVKTLCRRCHGKEDGGRRYGH